MINREYLGCLSLLFDGYSLIRIPDSFRKIVVVKDYMKPWRDDKGIQYVGVEQFLLDEDFLSR